MKREAESGGESPAAVVGGMVGESLVALIENTDDVIASYDREVRLLVFNEACRKVYKDLFNIDLKVGLRTLDLFPEASRGWWQAQNDRALSGDAFTADFELTFPDGEVHSFESAFNPIRRGGAVVGFSTFTRDVTLRRKLMASLERTARLESLGLLAGGIAHDFNNLLAAIYGNIDLARLNLGDHPSARMLGEAMATLDTARGLTGQLLTFSKGGAPIRTVGELFPAIRESAQFASRGTAVTCQFQCPRDLWPCNFDRIQVGQAIHNLVINAAQAMPAGGMVNIEASNATLGAGGRTGLPAGNYVEVRVRDHGTGIPPEVLPRIFDPFFTTKEKGTGLGLATTHSIIQRHGGAILVDSEAGRGTTFRFYLPGAGDLSPAAPAEIPSVNRGSGHVLVMDDEPRVLELLANILGFFGFRVHAVGSGDEALAAFEKESGGADPFCAVVLDLTVPGGMGGKEAGQRIREKDGRVPILLMSGYAHDPVMSDPAAHRFNGSLCKPFAVEDVASALRQCHLMETR